MLVCNKLVNIRRRALRAMEHTCPSSRHLLLMADCLAADGKYQMFIDDPKHCASTMYSVLESLWKARKNRKPNRRKVGESESNSRSLNVLKLQHE